jgi:hypothetical protein
LTDPFGGSRTASCNRTSLATVGLLVFHHYAGNGANIDCTTMASPHNIEFYSAAFNVIWELAIPRSDYKPA